jgi:ubiquinol-cytochrome c reductase subunit 7
MTSMLASFSQWFVNPRRNPLARIHMLTISSRLKNYGA